MPIRSESALHQFAALVLVLVSFALSGVVSDRVFERLPHLEDEMAYLFQAKTYARGDLVIESPEPRRAFWQPFVIDREGRRFGKYTPGWSALLAVGVHLGELWVINAFFGGLAVALVYRLGRDLFSADAGVIAAVLVTFSPMALLLNGTLMGHTSAFFGVLLFMYAYLRLTHSRRPLVWGLVAGAALGMVVASRPLTAVGVAIPFIAYSLVRLWSALRRGWRAAVATLRPLVALGGVALVFSLSIPIYNYAATGNPRINLYTLVWEYDQVGFGTCCGRSAQRGEGGHNLERGLRHTRFDLSLMAADLFGWQSGAIDQAVVDHWLNEGDYFPNLGLSWLLLPAGVVVGVGRRWLWTLVWLALGLLWVVSALYYEGGAYMRTPASSWAWLAVAFVWLCVPVFAWGRRAAQAQLWTWLLIAVALGLIGAQLTYWIGSQRYSTRYYYEALGALALLSALPLAWLAARARWAVAVIVIGVTVWGLTSYTVPRLTALNGYNFISRDVLRGVEARRPDDDTPVLVLVTGSDVRWRPLAALMAVSSPYRDSDIVAALDYGADGVREQILAQFPDRVVIEMQAADNRAWFADSPPPSELEITP